MQNVIYLKKTSQLKTHTAIYSVFRAQKERGINLDHSVFGYCGHVGLVWMAGCQVDDVRVLEVFITKYTVWLLTSAHIKIIIILFHYDRGRGRGVICQWV